MAGKPNSLERRNPLPPGRYWVTIEPINFEAFNEWKGSTKRIRLEASEAHEGDKPFEFNVFRILEPGEVAWPMEKFGAPSVAAEGVTSFSEVVRAPDIEEPDPRELVQQLIDLGKFALVGAGLIALVRIFGKK
jgi:hypothetical protein